MDDLIPRKSIEYICRKETVSTNPDDHEYSDKFIEFMNNDMVADFGRWQWANGFNTALVTVNLELKRVPSAQPYTAEEIQKMQELESAQLEMAYKLGLEEGRNTATWLIHKWGDDAQCSNCGRSFKDVYDMDNYDQYCRHCGTHMKGIRAI